jgi:capsular exopolysaccharide synthesis family protein
MNGELEIAGSCSQELHHAAERYPDPPKQVTTVAALRRHWRLVAGIIVAALIVMYLLCSILTPLYAAKTSIMIEPREPKRPISSADPAAALPPSEEAIRKNEMALMRSRNLADTVVMRLSLDQQPEFNPSLRSTSALQTWLERLGSLVPQTWLERLGSLVPQLGSSPQPLETANSELPEQSAHERAVEIFLKRLGTTSTEASRVIEIRFLSEDPVRAAQVANTVTEEYISQKLKQAQDEANFATRLFEQNTEDLNQEIRDGERMIEHMRVEHGLLSGASGAMIVERLSDVNRQLAAAVEERMLAEGRLEEVRSGRGPRGADAAVSVLDSLLIQRLQSDAAQLAGKIAEMSTVYSETHPKLIGARAELKDLQARLDAEIAKIVDSYRNAVAVAKAKEASLRQELESTKQLVAEANASEVDIRALERTVETKRTLLAQLVAKLTEAKAEINLRGREARVISRATVPDSPSFPPKLAMLAAAFLFSATGGTILALLLERSDDSVRSLAQIRQLTPCRVLGAIPIVKRLPQARALTEQRSEFVENLRAVWSQINHSASQAAKVLLFTSSVSTEGKSTVAACIGRILALAGRRVVIVDGDLRNPGIDRALGLGRSPGFAELITGGAELEDVLQIDPGSGAYAITAGIALSSPAEIFQSPRMPQIFSMLSTGFDVVILDSPPVLAVQDANLLASYADKTIMVVHWGATKIATFMTAMQRLSDFDVSVYGVVLSRVNRKRYRAYGSPDSEIFSRDFQKYHSSRAGLRAANTGQAR